MFIYTEKIIENMINNNLSLFIEETDNSTYFIKDELYPKVEAVLSTQEGQKKFEKIVEIYFNRHSSKLTTIGPQYLIPFTHKDKEDYYTLFNVTEPEITKIVLKVISSTNQKSNWTIIKSNPIYILFYCIIRYFTITNNSKQLRNALIVTSLLFYVTVYRKYFRFDPNPGVMHYTIDNLSNRFIIKKSNHIFGTLMSSIQSSWKFHEKDFDNGSDKECIRFIQRIRNDQNSLIKKIASNYMENHKKGLTISTSVDSTDEFINVDIENDTNKVESITNKVVTKLLINGVNLQVSDFAANATNISRLELRNYLTKIIIEKNGDTMKRFIESILFLYLYDEKHKLEEINSKQFIGFALLIFKKTNSKNENVLNIKKTLDMWATDSGIYGRYSRIPTRIDYTKAIFLYFIVSIQQYNNA